MNEPDPIKYYLQEDSFFYTRLPKAVTRSYDITLAEVVIDDSQVDIWP
jgi:hypothetical protein